MYIPRDFRNDDPDFALDFMRAYPFAELISINQNGRIIATHLPLLVGRISDVWQISGHISVANEQWRNLQEQESMLIFREPHAYVSPKHYDAANSVPTWNYASVHCYVNAKLLHTKEEKYEQMKEFVTFFESGYLPSFLKLPEEYLVRMFDGIVSFRFDLVKMEVKTKLSQNKNDGERQRIAETLADGNDLDRTIARMMQQRY
ncbi:MAG: FMN-binding negative transcriptional regulator [Flavobacteriales bacterium]|nr:FMN-binding negative transcriptional regulator [Flavobacteriales bacterium]